MAARIKRSRARGFFGFTFCLTCGTLRFLLSMDARFFGGTDSLKVTFFASGLFSSLSLDSQTLFFLGTASCFCSRHDLDFFFFATRSFLGCSFPLRLENALAGRKLSSRQGATAGTSTTSTTRTTCRATRTRSCTLGLAHLNLHDLGSAMAEALPYGAGIHCTTNILAACGA